VLVHYLNVPYPDDNKLVMASSISLWADKKEWTKEELISQLKPMCEYSVATLYRVGVIDIEWWKAIARVIIQMPNRITESSSYRKFARKFVFPLI